MKKRAKRWLGACAVLCLTGAALWMVTREARESTPEPLSQAATVDGLEPPAGPRNAPGPREAIPTRVEPPLESAQPQQTSAASPQTVVTEAVASEEEASAPTPADEPIEDVPVGALGTIEGSVSFTGHWEPLGVKKGSDPACARSESTDESILVADGKLANVFVQVLNPPTRRLEVPLEPVIVRQNNCMFQPHVAVAIRGQEIQFANDDATLHNVHVLTRQRTLFSMPQPAKTEHISTHPTTPPSPLTIRCDVHPWMRAQVHLVDHPFFALTGSDGTFQIKGLPPGRYEVEAWHERLGTRRVEVHLVDPLTRVGFEYQAPTQ
jgi:plastocyanin